jgi:hypothetical protein
MSEAAQAQQQAADDMMAAAQTIQDAFGGTRSNLSNRGL